MALYKFCIVLYCIVLYCIKHQTLRRLLSAVKHDVVCSTSLRSWVPDALTGVINHINVKAGLCTVTNHQRVVGILTLADSCERRDVRLDGQVERSAYGI